MMPDGSATIAARKEGVDYQTFAEVGLNAMHRRLIDYGLCWLRGGGLDSESMHREIVQIEPGENDDPSKLRIVPTSYAEPDEEEHRHWTQPEVESFSRLHSRIIRLPMMAHSLAIQIFYAEGIAAEWRWVPPDQKAKILRDLLFWSRPPYGLNARLRRAGDSRCLRSADDFLPLMLRGMRILSNGERMVG